MYALHRKILVERGVVTLPPELDEITDPDERSRAELAVFAAHDATLLGLELASVPAARLHDAVHAFRGDLTIEARFRRNGTLSLKVRRSDRDHVTVTGFTTAGDPAGKKLEVETCLDLERSTRELDARGFDPIELAREIAGELPPPELGRYAPAPTEEV